MMIDGRILSILLLLMTMIAAIPSNSYYLIDIAQESFTNQSYCSNLLNPEQLYYIPSQCHQHLICDPYTCDDRGFRCVKIRETLCCLYKYLQSHCEKETFVRTKEQFRSVYFHMSIEHGYCEINLERIEKIDSAYCLANHEETTTTPTPTTTTTRSTYKHYHRRLSTLRPTRNRFRLANRQNYSTLDNMDYLRQVTIIEGTAVSKCIRCSWNLSIFFMIFSIWFL